MLTLPATGARTMGGNLLLEVCWMLDRVGRIAAVGGAILGLIAARDGECVIAGWAGLAAVAGLLAVRLMSRVLRD